ncbi:MAG: extensin family protein, partial [Fimbriimonadaceae bacterium]|nr:extensin family protein [Alphaproteobacteria bacterium]
RQTVPYVPVALPAVRALSGIPVPLSALRPDPDVSAPPQPLQFDPKRTTELCRTALAGNVAIFRPLEPIADANGCGQANPVALTSIGDPVTKISVAATTNCAMAGAISSWTENEVQNAALTYLGEPIIGFKNASSYVCRSRNNQPGTKMSEHAFANAMDISAFRRASGDWIYVAEHWNVASAESQFLKAIHREACEYFTTVLGPDANASHQDHFHLDLGKHGRTGTYRICE